MINFEQLSELYHKGHHDVVLDVLLEDVNEMLRNGFDELLDQQLAGINVAEFSTTTLLGFLTFTAKAKDRLPSRAGLYDRIEKHFSEDRPWNMVEELLRGAQVMDYTMTTPCSQCPFTRGPKAVRLMQGRIKEIAGIMLGGARGDFQCHKTLKVDKPQHCAGALIFAEKNGTATQMMRICERLGMYDHTQLNMDADVFDDIDEMMETALNA